MENKHSRKSSPSILFPLSGGEGPYSYANNSHYQKMGLDTVKRLMQEEITKLDIEHHLSLTNLFRIADMGCAAGPNTFFVVQHIIDAVKFKCQSEDIEFQVFFNDHVGNDFNTLFRTIPVGRNYFATAVPGSFHCRLFPKGSLDFVNSSYAIHWLSKVPEEVQEKGSPAWNRGRILYGGCKDVEIAYADQFAKDLEAFLNSRAVEVVPGGFMALLLPSVEAEADPCKCTLVAACELLGSILVDMAQTGLVDEAELESFNLPFYFPSPAELKSIVQSNGWFKIENMHQLRRSEPIIEKFALDARAGLEEGVRDHFGGEITDELFNKYTEKLVESEIFSNHSLAPMLDLFIFLKRKSE